MTARFDIAALGELLIDFTDRGLSDAGIGQAAICEVDQQLAQRRDIEPGGHDRASGYSLHSRR